MALFAADSALKNLVAGARFVNYRLSLAAKPHRHPTDGTAIVLQGTYLLGVGETYDPAKQQALTVGDYVYVPKEVAHFDSCKGETVLYAHGIGPLEFNWVNPADDPAKSAKPQ